ncbi:MAG: UvrB/UvrC motif-containing protein, partial [Gallicola sp.]|nr:UvrB/UvrC motif-containing protein [Gallicola sp.]
IMVEEPSVSDSILILEGLRDKYEAHHGVKISDDAIKAAVELSHRYLNDRFLPDKAIDLIDEAASKKKVESFKSPASLKHLEESLKKLNKEKEEAVNSQNFEKAAAIRDEEKYIKAELNENYEDWKSRKSQSGMLIDFEEIAQIVSEWSGVPVTKMDVEESNKLLNLENELNKRVIGQHAAVNSLSKSVKRARVGLKDPNKPIGSFIFVGPTGVGKTKHSIRIAKDLNGEIISCDSFQIYKYMDIGTAKVTEDEADGITHHNIDIVYPDEDFNVALFKKRTEDLIQDIVSRGKVPILTGGTGLYLHSLIYDLDFSGGTKDTVIRKEIEKEIKEKGIESIYNKLISIDIN